MISAIERPSRMTENLAVRIEPTARLPSTARAGARAHVKRAFWEVVPALPGLCPSGDRTRATQSLAAVGRWGPGLKPLQALRRSSQCRSRNTRRYIPWIGERQACPRPPACSATDRPAPTLRSVQWKKWKSRRDRKVEPRRSVRPLNGHGCPHARARSRRRTAPRSQRSRRRSLLPVGTDGAWG